MCKLSRKFLIKTDPTIPVGDINMEFTEKHYLGVTWEQAEEQRRRPES